MYGEKNRFHYNYIIIIITQLVTRHKSITISDESKTRDRRVSLAKRATVKNVFRLRLKTERDDKSLVSSCGRLFQIVGAA